MNDSTVKTFVKAIKAEKKDPSPYDTTAKVTRVEGNTAWVHISGGVDETPVRMTVNAEVGDEVQVRVGGGKAWITGNATAPPTDDKTALLARIEGIEAKQKAREAAAKADVANDKADTATQYASDALDAASGSLVTDILHYLATSLSSGVTIHTAGWTTTPQTISENNPYLWTYHTYTKASGTQTNTTPVIIGTYGKDGTSVTILGSYNTLAELETAHPTGSIGDSYLVSGDLYVWNGSAWENVGQIQGPKGDPGTPGTPGTGVAAVQSQYYLSTSSSSATGGSWGTTLTYETGKYIWTREQISYSNNTTGYSTAIYNQALTQACSDAMQALEVAQEVNQYTWHTETDTGAGAGLHITTIPQEDFLADPANGGSNLLAQADGLKIRNGLTTRAEFGETVILGDFQTGFIRIGANGLSLNSPEAQLASFSSDGIVLKTNDGANALSVLPGGDTVSKEINIAIGSWFHSPGTAVTAPAASTGTIVGKTKLATGIDAEQIIVYLTAINRAYTTPLIPVTVEKPVSGENSVLYDSQGQLGGLYLRGYVQFTATGDVYLMVTVDNPTSQDYRFPFSYQIYVENITYNKDVPVPLLETAGIINTSVLQVNDAEVVDYIVETGSSGIWKWNKYASGKIECWGEKSWSSVACTTSAGGGYRSADVTQALPSGLFTAIDSCQATMKGSGGSGYAMALRTLCTTTTVTQMFWNTSSATKTNLVVDYYIIGT